MKSLKGIFKYYTLMLMRKMHYRTYFFLSTTSSFLYYLLTLVFFGFIYTKTQEIAGFSFLEIICLQGITTLVVSTFTAFFGSGAPKITNAIITGRIELYMVKPINWKIFPLIVSSNPYRLLSVLLGIFLIGFSVNQTHIAIEPLRFLLFLLSIGLSILSVLFFHLIIGSISMRIRLYSLPWIYWDITEFSSYPYKIVPKPIFIILTVIPAFGISAFSEGLLMRNWPYSRILFQALVVLVLYLAQKLMWKYMGKIYAGSGTVK